MTSPPVTAPLDCLIIGAGVGGLVAATYLGRFRRRFAIIDSGNSRLAWIPTSHNYPGFVQGIHGRDVWRQLREQAAHYGTDVIAGTVERLQRQDDGSFVAQAGERRLHARTVLLATGVSDIAPAFDGAAQALADGHLRYCPVCDGYEAIDRDVVVLGNGSSGVGEALFVRHYTPRLVLMTSGGEPAPTDEQRAQLAAHGIAINEQRVRGMAYRDGRIRLALDEGVHDTDIVYAAYGTRVNGSLAAALGARCADDGQIIVDAHMQTSVDNLYAAGDVVDGLNQISVAMGHAAIAATAIHNRL